MLKAMKENLVINSVKSSGEVEEDEEGGGARVRSHQDITGDSDESYLGAVRGTLTRLEFLIQTIRVQMRMQQNGNNSFQNFGDKGEIRDGSVI